MTFAIGFAAGFVSCLAASAILVVWAMRGSLTDGEP